MIHARFMRLFVVAGVLFATACDGEEKRPAHVYSVEACKVLLGRKDYRRAVAEAEGVLATRPDNSEARYCAVLAHVASAFQAWSAIFGLLGAQLSPPANISPQKNIKEAMGSILSDIEQFTRAADEQINILAQDPDPRIEVDEYYLDAEPILEFFLMLSHDNVVVMNGSANLRGTWDRSHLLILGAFVNGVQTMRDYLFAHNITLDLADLPDTGAEDVSMEFARFFIRNPRFLGFDVDTDDIHRIEGNEQHDGLKNQALAMVSYLAGRNTTVAHVAPANRGLSHAIAQSAASGSTDAPIQWIDDGDGIPEKLVVPSLPELEIIVDGVKYDKPTIDNPLGQELWKALVILAADVRTNLEAKSPAPISLQPVLQAAFKQLPADPANADVRLFKKAFPNVIAINPGAFFSDPVAIRDLLPFSFTFSSGVTTYSDLAIESEYYVSPTENYLEKLGKNAATGLDFAHFDYTGFPQTVSDYTVTSYAFFNGGLVPELLAADGITDTAKSPLLYSFAFPYPGFGGLVVADPKGFTGTPTFEAPDNGNLNLALNRFIQYYCLDLTLGVQESVDEKAYDETNRIEDCKP